MRAVAAIALVLALQSASPADISVTMNGKMWTQQSLFQRNIGGRDDMTTPFPAHHVIGNVYYVGTVSLTSYLITTPQGHILVNTTFERNIPAIQKSVEQLGFKFSDIKILLGNHAHGDHQEGDAMVKQLTGAQVMVMAEDVPALQGLKPGGKEHPIDKVLHDGDTVNLGGVTMVAHLTAGHTRGCTTWTTTAQEAGKTYNVVFGCSLRAPNAIPPDVATELTRSFELVRRLPCDVPLGDHPAEYRLQEKFANVKPDAANPFIDPAGCHLEADIQEAMFHAILAEQAQRPPGK